MQIKFPKFNFKKEKSFKKEDSQRSINFFWRLALLFTFFMIFISFFFGYQLFTKINQESILPSGSNEVQVQTVKKEDMDKTLQYFTDRAKKSDQIISSPPPVVDPSL
jgi:hypothetical protein